MRAYRINVAAEMSGVSEGLIRAWERRYGVLKPRRTPSGYRAYTEADIAVLRRLKQLTVEGVSIAEAVRLLPTIKRDVRERLDEGDRPGPRSPKAGQTARWRQDVLAAAGRLAQHEVEAVLDEAAASMTPVGFWEEVLVPLLEEVGVRWHAGTLSIAEEHLVTQAARQRVIALLHHAPRRARQTVVCACGPEEDHELGLLGAALRFRHAGWRVTFLGARTPAEHLARVVSVTQPDVVALSFVNDQGAEALERWLAEVVKHREPETLYAVGGRAALRHRGVAEALGVRVVDTPEAWQALLD